MILNCVGIFNSRSNILLTVTGYLCESIHKRCSLISKMDMDPRAILYVGDSLRKDIEGAKRAGLRTALLSKKEESGSADIVFRDWSELDRVLF